MNRFLYAFHRWASMVIVAQLVIWIGSGLFFSSFPIARVRGEHVEIDASLDASDGAALISPSTAIAIVAARGVAIESLELRRSPAGPVWVGRGRHHVAVRLDARTGAVVPVERAEAEAVARRDQRGSPEVAEAVLVERDPPIEYRDHALPAWRVRLADEAGTVVWVDARTAQITARRNDLWRWYDFLWSLHIMDWRGRESFHHPILIVAASLAAIAVTSGSALWLVRIVRRLQRRRQDRVVAGP